MRRIYALCAAAALGLTALAVTTPADAAFHLIRWEGTGICQIWDESIPTKPSRRTTNGLEAGADLYRRPGGQGRHAEEGRLQALIGLRRTRMARAPAGAVPIALFVATNPPC